MRGRRHCFSSKVSHKIGDNYIDAPLRVGKMTSEAAKSSIGASLTMPAATPQHGESHEAFIHRCLGEVLRVHRSADEEPGCDACERAWRESRQAAAGDNRSSAAPVVETTGERRMTVCGRMPTANEQVDVSVVRTVVSEGRPWLVLPAVALVPGVLNGALVPAEEVAHHVQAWNGVPISVGHPQKDGQYVSANSPDINSTFNVGVFYNAHFDDRLRGEFWIDIDKANALGFQHLVSALQSGRNIMEVSTAYWSDDEPSPGMFGGTPFKVVHRNLKPDHIALLPTEEGACNVKQGCGVPRLNKTAPPDSKESVAMPETENHVSGAGTPAPESDVHVQESDEDKDNKPTHHELEDNLSSALQAEGANAWVRDVGDDWFVYTQESQDADGNVTTRLLKRGYSVGEDGNVLLDTADNAVEVVEQRHVDYVPVEDVAANTEDEDEEEDESDMSNNDANSNVLAAKPAEAQPAEPPAANVNTGTPSTAKPAKPTAKPTINANDIRAALAEVPEVKFILERHKRQRQEAISRLKSNSRCRVDAERLARMDLDTLEELEESLADANYAGRGSGVQAHNAADDSTPPAPPAILLAAKKE